MRRYGRQSQGSGPRLGLIGHTSFSGELVIGGWYGKEACDEAGLLAVMHCGPECVETIIRRGSIGVRDIAEWAGVGADLSQPTTLVLGRCLNASLAARVFLGVDCSALEGLMTLRTIVFSTIAVSIHSY